MKCLISILCVVLFVACHSNIDSKDNSGSINVANDSITNLQPRREFSNPALIYGSSFGNYFQVLYKQGKFNEMVQFTSKTSRNRFGDKAILKAFKLMDFGYLMKLSNIQKKSDSLYLLNYEIQEMATNKILRMTTIIESDTIKLIVNDTIPEKLFF
jgi:hypothetical protein